MYQDLSAWDRVYLARHPRRPKAQDYLKRLFHTFYELHGDRCYGDDRAIIGGIAMFEQTPVTVIAQAKGRDLQENMKRNFGMPNPEGYRKALRLAKEAEKFHRPIITFVDTSGAYPGKGAEERGQAEAIAQCLYTFSDLQTPIICIVLSEGGSGGRIGAQRGRPSGHAGECGLLDPFSGRLCQHLVERRQPGQGSGRGHEADGT